LEAADKRHSLITADSSQLRNDNFDKEEYMTRIDERLGVATYLRATMKTVDGLAWFIVSIASMICFLDVLFGANVIPLRDSADSSKAVVLLLFSPLLVFLILVWLRQFPFGVNRIAMWIRAGLCVACHGSARWRSPQNQLWGCRRTDGRELFLKHWLPD